MSQYWVIAADSTEARLFERAKKFSPLVEQQDFLHPESRLRGADLETDRQGKTFSSHGYGQSDNQKPTDPKTREARDFAHELAERLNKARARGEFQRLQIVAEPSFLGLLREQMDSETRECVERAVDKNLTRRSPETIAGALDADR